MSVVRGLVAIVVVVWAACHEPEPQADTLDTIGTGDAGDTGDLVHPDDTATTATIEVDATTADTWVPSDGDSGDTLDAPDSDLGPEVCTPAARWSRSVVETGGVVSFDELHLDPDGAGWVELYDRMSVDVDLSGWTLHVDDTLVYTFPEGTFIAGGGRAVVPIAALSPAGATLELRNNTARLMDAVTFDDAPPWPTRPADRTLVKRDAHLPSPLAESWRASAEAGGTPGAASTTDTSSVAALVPRDATWRYETTGGSPDPQWREATFDDSAWSSGAAPISAGADTSTSTLTVRATADNAFAIYIGARDGEGMALVGRDTDGDWTSPEDLQVVAGPADHLFIAAWEAVGDDVSPQMLIAELARPDGTSLATGADTFDVVLAPPDDNPALAAGGIDAPAPEASSVAAVIAAADDAGTFVSPGAELDKGGAPWGGAVGGAFTSARFIWSDTFDASSATNTLETYALFRSVEPIVPAATTVLPSVGGTLRLRTRFESTRDPATTRLVLGLDASAGAIVWLNGQEIHRAGVAPDPALSSPLRVRLPADALRSGTNTLAVEVHPLPARPPAPPSLRFALTLDAEPGPLAIPDDNDDQGRGPIVINEIMYHPNDRPADGEAAADWIELHNPTSTPVDVSGWHLVDGVTYTFPPASIVPANGFVVLADELQGRLANGGERVALVDACGVVIDAVRWADDGRWPSAADGWGASLALVDPHADNAVPEAWVASDESARAAWQTIRYSGVAGASAVGPDGAWEELVLGLLDAGEVLIDDVVVTRDDTGLVLLATDFEGLAAGDTQGWRARGTHAGSRVTLDPDAPDNHVLRVVATGPTEHMHNLVEHTLASPVEPDASYTISLRARWVAGADLLNTRLYFNRLARTTRLGIPAGGGSPGRANPAVTNHGPTWQAFDIAPAVPTPDEPVVVSVLARDPDDIAAVWLWTAVDDQPATATPMEPATSDPCTPPCDRHGYRRYEATLPGRPDGTIVQLWITGEDVAGATTHFPARGPDSRALYIVARPLTRPAGLHTLRLVMTKADSDAFHAAPNLMSNALTRCTVIVDEARVMADVGVRAKGSQRGRPSSARLGFTLTFDPLDRLFGVHERVALDRSEGVGTGQRELLLDLAMAHAGSVAAEYNDLVHLIAPRPEHTGPALLQTGRFGDVMLDNQFASGSDGSLFEYELVYYPTTTDTGLPDGQKLPQPDEVVGTSIRDLGDDPEAYRHSFLVKNRRRDDDYAALIAFAKVMGDGGDDFATSVPAHVDLDQWLRSFAFMRLSGAVDHYGNGDQHNAQIYFRPDDPRALLFPHDLDYFVGGPDAPLVHGGDLARLLALPGQRRTFYAHVLDIVTTTWNASYLARWGEHLAALLPGQPFASHVAFMVDRAAWVMDLAPDAVRVAIPEVAFAITTNGGLPLTTSATQVTIEGTGWLDVATIVRAVSGGAGAASEFVVWTADTQWSIDVPLAIGSQVIVLEARDRRGNLVGQDQLVVERSL